MSERTQRVTRGLARRLLSLVLGLGICLSAAGCAVINIDASGFRKFWVDSRPARRSLDEPNRPAGETTGGEPSAEWSWRAWP